ncbi:MAG TPA: GNAT family N-acetyltransferase [Streptosporangiaceae bacterium]|nr:GNAT family N-acetyltransferase [Streptosporangiaceae bacterium]
MTGVSIRLARPADAGTLADLIRSAYRGEGSRAGWTSEADLVGGERINADQVRASISDSDSLMLVGEDADVIVACCQLRNQGAGLAYFGTFAVSPEAQGAGLGRQLMAEAEREAVAAFNATRLEMTVLAVVNRDRAEEVDDDSPAAQTLNGFLRVVDAVTRQPEAECDPAQLQLKLLG